MREILDNCKRSIIFSLQKNSRTNEILKCPRFCFLKIGGYRVIFGNCTRHKTSKNRIPLGTADPAPTPLAPPPAQPSPSPALPALALSRIDFHAEPTLPSSRPPNTNRIRASQKYKNIIVKSLMPTCRRARNRNALPPNMVAISSILTCGKSVSYLDRVDGVQVGNPLDLYHHGILTTAENANHIIMNMNKERIRRTL